MMDTTTDTPAAAPAADPASPPAGMDAIPADLRNSEHGDMPLEYTLQNFNALVAANTAMQTELSAAGVRDADLRAQISTLETTVGDLRTAATGASAELASARALRKTAEDERDFQRDLGDALQRRLDRSLGYLDRVVDQEEAGTPPDWQLPPKRGAVGPNLDEISMPSRQRADGGFWPGSSIAMTAGADRTRRF